MDNTLINALILFNISACTAVLGYGIILIRKDIDNVFRRIIKINKKRVINNRDASDLLDKYISPELNESDERIRQSIIADIKSRLNNCTHTMDNYYKQQIGWLEKQDEQISVNKCEYEQGYEACIKNAVEFLKSYRRDTYDGTGYIPGIVDDQTIEDFEKTLKLKEIDIGLSKSLKGPNPPIYL